MCMVRHYPLGVAGMVEKAIEYSVDGSKLLAVLVARQAMHFGSDYFTKQGLPVPSLSMMNDNLIMKMTENGMLIYLALQEVLQFQYLLTS